jgi:Multicopper oxidase
LNKTTALIGTALLLTVIILGTALTAFLFTPQGSRQSATTQRITASISSVGSNATTELVLSLRFPNGTKFSAGSLIAAGSTLSKPVNGDYFFSHLTPGNYSITTASSFPSGLYLPSNTIGVNSGRNFANLTLYTLQVFVLIQTSGLSYNGTQPGPAIHGKNESAVRIVLRNNTTLIHNIAIVQTLGNSNATNILFSSNSNSLNPGGTTNDTFIVNEAGSFFYSCLIGSHSSDGEWGVFEVLPSSASLTRAPE